MQSFCKKSSAFLDRFGARTVSRRLCRVGGHGCSLHIGQTVMGASLSFISEQNCCHLLARFPFSPFSHQTLFFHNTFMSIQAALANFSDGSASGITEDEVRALCTNSCVRIYDILFEGLSPFPLQAQSQNPMIPCSERQTPNLPPKKNTHARARARTPPHA